MCEQAWRATQCAASKKRERPAKKRVGTLNKKKGAVRAARPPRAMGTACGVVLHKRERRCVRALVQRGQRAAAGVARAVLRVQQHRSCVMIVSPSGLWVRARAGVWVFGDAAEDGDVH